MCHKIAGEQQIVNLKGSDKPEWEWENFFKGSSSYNFLWDFVPYSRRSFNVTMRKACGLFSRNGDKICQTWIDENYGGNWELAMRKNRNFENFFGNFEKYFAKRRQAFMDATTDIIKLFRPDLKNVKPLKTNSHGGVANLLKVLTKTMNDQGANITSIAKMQYLVATQAGIYIPDEFITDVCVAMTANPAIIKEEENNAADTHIR